MNGTQLRMLRAGTGLTQGDICEAAGVSGPTYRKCEACGAEDIRNSVNYTVAKKIEDFFHAAGWSAVEFERGGKRYMGVVREVPPTPSVGFMSFS